MRSSVTNNNMENTDNIKMTEQLDEEIIFDEDAQSQSLKLYPMVLIRFIQTKQTLKLTDYFKGGSVVNLMFNLIFKGISFGI